MIVLQPRGCLEEWAALPGCRHTCIRLAFADWGYRATDGTEPASAKGRTSKRGVLK